MPLPPACHHALQQVVMPPPPQLSVALCSAFTPASSKLQDATHFAPLSVQKGKKHSGRPQPAGDWKAPLLGGKAGVKVSD